jgi:dienelactone hydrolase
LPRGTRDRAYVSAVTDHTLRRTAVLGLALAALLATGTVSPPTASAAPATALVGGDTVPAVTDLGPTSFSQPGPYGVGEKTLALPTNGAPVEVWFPAKKSAVAGAPGASYDVVDWLPEFLKALLPKGASVSYPSGGVRGVAVAPGRFPLVVFSHGYAGFRDQSTFLTSWLASWGFVVAAPDHYSRGLTKVLGGPAGGPGGAAVTTDVGDLRATLTLMRQRAGNRSTRFYRHVDTSRVAAVGHSAGGAAVEAWAATDRRVTTFVGLAGATVGAFGETEHGPGSLVPHQPGMLMAGTSDGVVDSADMIAAYGHLQEPKRLILVGGGHHAFSDLCEVGASQGGLLAVAELLHFPVPPALVPLASDGCNPPALPPTEAWPAIRQATVAQLRHVFGFDTSEAGLTGLVEAFPGVVADSQSAGQGVRAY